MANYGIVYATGSKMVRRIVVTDDEKTLDARHVGAGESLLIADKKGGSDLFAARAAVKAATGIEPPDPACAVVAKDGKVAQIIAADPELDAVEGHDLVKAYAGVTDECTYDKATDTFIAPLKVIPETIIQQHIDEDGNLQPETIIPGRVDGGPIPKPIAVQMVDVEVVP